MAELEEGRAELAAVRAERERERSRSREAVARYHTASPTDAMVVGVH